MNRLERANDLVSVGYPLYDYIIVGAGVSGLQSAQILTQIPCSLIIVEAQDQEGGRVNTLSIADLEESKVGWVDKNRPKFAEVMIEKGATWVEEGHTVLRRMCKDRGIKLNLQFSKGSPIFLDRQRSYTNKQLMESEKYGPAIKSFITKLDYLSQLYDEKVLSAKELSSVYYKMLQEYDSKTVIEYLEEQIQQPHVRALIENFFQHTQCISCDENSMHQVLIKNARSKDLSILKQFLGIYGHQPSYLLDGGSFQLIDKFREKIEQNIKEKLSTILKLRHQVVTIDNKRPDFSTVVAIDHITNQVVKFRGKRIICSVPIAVIRSISFTNISDAKRYIFDNQIRTTCAKSFIITKKPFWRHFATGDGLFSYEYPINMSHDISPQDESCGIIVFFHSGKKYVEWQTMFKQAADENYAKKNYLIDIMCKFFLVKENQKKTLFDDCIFHQSTFMHNPFIRSGFQSNTRPGTYKRIIKMKDTLNAYYRDQNGVIFVGSEFSKKFASYIQGAIRSARDKIYPLIGKIDPYDAQMKC